MQASIDSRNLADIVEKIISNHCKYCKVEQLYPCQREALQKVLGEFLSRDSVRGIVQMPTGTGKTVLATALILAVWKYYNDTRKKDKMLALFLAPRRVIRSQARRKFDDIVTNGSMGCIEVFEASRDNLEVDSSIAEATCKTISKFINLDHTRIQKRTVVEQICEVIEKIPSLKKKYESKCKNLETRGLCKHGVPGLVIVATDQLLHHLSKNKYCLETIKTNVDILIIDEAHAFITGERTIRIVKNILEGEIPVVIGLTATPTKDSIDLLGKLIYNKLSKEAMNEGILVQKLRIIMYKTKIIDPRTIAENKSINPDDAWKYAIRERARKYAEKIIEELNKIMKDAKLTRIPKTLVVAANTREAHFICEELKELRNLRKLPFQTWINEAHYKIDQITNDNHDGYTVKNKDPHKVIEEFKGLKSGILVTVDMTNMGFDDPELEVLVLARPITSPVAYVQLRGRVLRKARSPDNLKSRKYAVLIDLVGKKNIKITEEKLVPKVELGVYGKNEFVKANSELEGLGIVKLATANIEVKHIDEFIVPEKRDLRKRSQSSVPPAPLISIICTQIKRKGKYLFLFGFGRSRGGSYYPKKIIIQKMNVKLCEIVPPSRKLSKYSDEEIRNKILKQLYQCKELKRQIRNDLGEWKVRLNPTIKNAVIQKIIEDLTDEIIKKLRRYMKYTK